MSRELCASPFLFSLCFTSFPSFAVVLFLLPTFLYLFCVPFECNSCDHDQPGPSAFSLPVFWAEFNCEGVRTNRSKRKELPKKEKRLKLKVRKLKQVESRWQKQKKPVFFFLLHFCRPQILRKGRRVLNWVGLEREKDLFFPTGFFLLFHLVYVRGRHLFIFFFLE